MLSGSAWAEKRGFLTAKAARPDVYRAANHILRLALEGRLCLCTRPPGFTKTQGMSSRLVCINSGKTHDKWQEYYLCMCSSDRTLWGSIGIVDRLHFTHQCRSTCDIDNPLIIALVTENLKKHADTLEIAKLQEIHRQEVGPQADDLDLELTSESDLDSDAGEAGSDHSSGRESEEEEEEVGARSSNPYALLGDDG